MEYEESWVEEEDEVASEPEVVRCDDDNRYGSVPGLPDEELASPAELERQVYLKEFGPALALPVRGRKWDIRPSTDEDGQVDWGAFGTVDFWRYSGGFDKAGYKEHKLREELRNIRIDASIVKDRVSPTKRRLVLGYLQRGIIELEHIVDEDLLILAKLYLRARRIQREIKELEEKRARRAERELAKLLG